MNPLPLLLFTWLVSVTGDVASPASPDEQPPSPRVAGSICSQEEVLFKLAEPGIDPPSRSDPPYILRDGDGEYWALIIERFPANRQAQLHNRNHRTWMTGRGDLRAAYAVASLASAKAHRIDLFTDLEGGCFGSARPAWAGDRLATGWICRSPAIDGLSEAAGSRSFFVHATEEEEPSPTKLCAGDEFACSLHALTATSAGQLWAIWSDQDYRLWAELLPSSPEASTARGAVDNEEETGQVVSAPSRFAIVQVGVPSPNHGKFRAAAFGDQLVLALAAPHGQDQTSIQLYRFSSQGQVGEAIPISSQGRIGESWVDLALNPNGLVALAWIWQRQQIGKPPEARLRVVSLFDPKASASEIHLFGDENSPPSILALYTSRMDASFLVGWIEQRDQKPARLLVQELDASGALRGQPWLISDRIQPGYNGRFHSPRSQSLWLFNGEVLWRTWSRDQDRVDEIRRCVIDVETMRAQAEPAPSEAPAD